MKGCLAKDSGGDYFLVPQHGAKVQVAVSNDVISHVGQQVKLSGAFVDAKPPDGNSPADPGKNSSNDEKSGTIREFRVVKVDVLNATCSSASAKRK